MSSSYYCSPPIHGASLSGKVYLVTIPQAKAPGRGVYPSWEPAQRVSEGVTRGGAVKYDSYNLSLPAWHDCCDAGEHDHPANPQSGQSAPIPAPTVTPAPPATPVTPRRACPVFSATPKCRAPAPAAIPQLAAAAAPRYAISGTGIVYTDLHDALDHFERVVTPSRDCRRRTAATTTSLHHRSPVPSPSRHSRALPRWKTAMWRTPPVSVPAPPLSRSRSTSMTPASHMQLGNSTCNGDEGIRRRLAAKAAVEAAKLAAVALGSTVKKGPPKGGKAPPRKKKKVIQRSDDDYAGDE
ncbi:hypothetical protein C8R47DRAFT_1199901 [Mycena vitilis]|nr:hypothetical protein C8R47DRAFT_1199901 [Mycena vitilis]